MLFHKFKKSIKKSYPTFHFNKPLSSARNTLIERVSLIKRINPDGTVETLGRTLKENIFKSVVIRTYLLKQSYDFLIRHACLYKHEKYQKNNSDAVIWRLIRTYLILLKGFLVLRIKKNFPVAKNAYFYDNNPCNTLFKKCIQYEQIVYSENEKNADNTPVLLYDPNDPDPFAPYGHLWTFCKNCETSIYKQDAKKNNYICHHCGYHLQMESLDRIESLIDSGTWDPVDENMVSINPYTILKNNKEEKEELERFSDNEDFEVSPSYSKKEEFEEDEEDEEDGEESPKIEIEISSYPPEIFSDLKKFEEEEFEDFVNSLPEPEKELGPLGLDGEESTIASAEESTAEQISAEESTAEQISAEESTAEQISAEKSTAEEPIVIKCTLKEFLQLVILEEKKLKATIEEKEKNLASADDEDSNQNLKESKKSEDSEEDLLYEEKDIPYVEYVHSYQREKGLTEAIQTGIGQLDGIPVALAVMDFEFIGGSMGSVVGEKITRLIEYATNQSLPLIISCASGGARMQEGSFSLMQMAKISSVLLDYQLTNNLFLVSLLTTPTTGGVTASFGMLGNIIIGEPDAYIAFAGKVIIEEVMKIEVPEGIQETEFLFAMGSMDLIVPRNLLKGVLSELLKFHGFFPLNKNKNKI